MKRKNSLAKILCLSFALPLFFVDIPANSVHADSLEHKHNNIEFTAWTSQTELPSEAGNYYLSNDIVLEEQWNVPTGTTNLCLNGYVISAVVKDKSDDDVIWVDDDTVLNIYDCDSDKPNYFKDDTFGDYDYWIHDNTLTGTDIKHTILGGAINGSTYRGITVYNTGILNMYGGTICKSTAQVDYGGAVWCYGGTFNMYEGVTLTENYCDEGGAIFVYDSNENMGQFNMYGGTITNNHSGANGGGVSVMNGSFNMYDGTISNNTAYGIGGGVTIASNASFLMENGLIENNIGCQGGGLSVGDFFGEGTAIMKGGTIKNNKAIQDEIEMGGVGGGVFVLDGSTFKADGGEIVNNNAKVAGGGIYLSMQTEREPYYCVAGDTLVTLGDGTTKKAEELEVGEMIRAFDHETGELTTSEVFYIDVNKDVSDNVMTLSFTNDIDIVIISGHSFFNKEENKYVTITPSNYESYVGKQFYNADTASWETLESGTPYNEEVDSYSIVTKGTINFVTNGMLSCGDELYLALSNIFDFGEDLKYDQTKKQADITTYGTYAFEDCQFATKATYDAFNLKYLKVALGKGILTADYLKEAAEYQNYIGGGLVSKRCVFLGGDIKVSDNTHGDDVRDNVFVWNNKGTQKIVIGNGTGEGKNGVKEPSNKMSVGVSLMEYEETGHISKLGIISINGKADYIANFFSDDDTKAIVFKQDHLELGYADVKVPTIETTTFVYDGTEKTFAVPTNSLYTIEGDLTGTNVGEYSVKLVLNNKEMNWETGDNNDIELKFHINQRVSDVEVVYEGSTPEEQSPISIVGADLGIAPDAVLVVKVVKLEDENDIKQSKEALNNENAIKDNETIYGCYDAKLLLNDVEIQPDGKIKIKMQIPQELLGKVYRVYHIHAGTEVYEIDDFEIDGNFLIFETDKLSQFAFVGPVEEPDNPDIPPAPAPDGDDCIVHWFMIATLAIGVILFVIFKFVFRSKFLSGLTSGIGLLISIIIALFGKCNICSIFKIVNILVFEILLIVTFLIGHDEDDDEEEEEPVEEVNPAIEEKPVEEDNQEVQEETIEEAVEETNEDSLEKDEQPQVSLKDSLAKMNNINVKSKMSKAFIAEYLGKNYKDEVELNCRANTTKPAKGQKVGLPLADTHYVKNGDSKKCFIYVYEKNNSVLLLVNTTKEHSEELAKDHENIARSAFPKSKDKWYSIVLDDSWDEDSVGNLLDRIVNLPKVETPKLGLPNGMGKNYISDYLKNTFGKQVSCNCRDNNAKPAKGHEVGLPLADTHYVKVGKTKKCFMYVYNRDGQIQILVNVDQEYIDNISKFHKNVSQSAFPKSKEQWYSINLDNSWDKDDLANLMNYAFNYAKEAITK